MIKKLKTAWRRFRKYWGRDLSWLEFKGPAAVAHVNMKEYLKKLEVKKQIKALAKINARSQIHIEGAGVMSRPTLDIIKSEEAKKQIAALPEFIEHMQIRTKLDIAPPLFT